MRPRAGSALGLMILIFWGTLSFGESGAAARALETVRSDTRVAQYLQSHPGTRTGVHFAERYQVWIVEFLREGKEHGFASVNPSGDRVLELDLRRRPAESDREKLPEREGVGLLVPHLEGSALLLVFLIVACLAACALGRTSLASFLDLFSLSLLFPFQFLVWRHTALAFAGMYGVTLYYLFRFLKGALSSGTSRPMDSPKFPLAFALTLIFLCHIRSLRTGGVDDAGIWSVLGAEHILQTGSFPYGSFKSGGDTYGPLLYLLHAPAVLLWPPRDPAEIRRRLSEDDGLPAEPDIPRLDLTATRVVVGLFDLANLILLVFIGRKMGGAAAGLAAAILFAASPYVIRTPVGGLGWASHVVPVTFTLLALALEARPRLAGVALGCGAAALYYPAFAFPLGLRYYLGKGQSAFRFGAAFAGTVALWLGLTLWLTRPVLPELKDRSGIAVLVERTWGTQEGGNPQSYGNSRFGLWGQFPALRFFKKPIFVAYLLFCVLLFFWPRPLTYYQWVCLTGAVFLGTQLWKTHGGGSYVEWYFPFLVLAMAGTPPVPLEPAQEPFGISHARAGFGPPGAIPRPLAAGPPAGRL